MFNLTSTDAIIVLILIAIIFILVGMIGVLDSINRKKRREDLEDFDESNNVHVESHEEVLEDINDNKLSESDSVVSINEAVDVPTSEPVVISNRENPNHINEIRYVEEDEELERTNAKLELEQLKEDLLHQEEMQKKEEAERNIVLDSTEEEVPLENKAIPSENVSQIADVITEDVQREEIKEANISKATAVQEDLNELLEHGIDEKIAIHEDEQEKKAIISVDEISKISDNVYDDNERRQASYQDEGDEPISLGELESLYNTRELNTVKLDDFNSVKQEHVETIINENAFKRLEDLPPIAMEHKFKSSPFISPVYGINSKDNLELEQTANLDKMNEEIKKTNEFLKALKELQKNLD